MTELKRHSNFVLRPEDRTDIPPILPYELPRGVAAGWWFYQSIKNAVLLFLKKMVGYKYTQEKSFKSYEHGNVISQEETWVNRDRARVSVYNGKLCVTLHSYSRRFLVNKLLEEIRSTPDVKTVLDFGCGGGINFVNVALNLNGPIVHGFDYSPNRVESAKRLSALFGVDASTLSVRDGKKLDFPDGAFDVVFTGQVLEQLNYDAETVLKEVGRVAKKKVILIEPIYERGNVHQKLYMLEHDYLRGLFKKAKVMTSWKLERFEPFTTYSNPLHPIGILVFTPVGAPPNGTATPSQSRLATV